MKTEKKIKAWAFMADSQNGKYFITDMNEMAEIYLKKPKPINHPFDYSGRLGKWEPTELTIFTN